MPWKAADQGNSWPVEDDASRTALLRHIKHLFLRFLQGLFSQVPDPYFVWSADQASTKIIITDECPVDLERYGHKPTITTVMGGAAMQSLAFDDVVGTDMTTGQVKRAYLVSGTMVINSLSANAQETQDMAWFLFEMFVALRGILREAGFHEIARNMQTGPVSQAGALVSNDAGRGWYNTSLYVPFFIQRVTVTTPLGAPVANKIRIWMTGAGAPPPEPENPMPRLSTYGTKAPTVAFTSNSPAPGAPGVEVEYQMGGVFTEVDTVQESQQGTGGISPIEVRIE